MRHDNSVRAVVFAYSSFGYGCLEELLDKGVDVAAVFTHEDDPYKGWFRSVRELAASRHLAVYTPTKLGEAELALIRSLSPDLIFSCWYRLLIPEDILRLAPLGAFNMHAALLPRYRGHACVNWAIIRGEKEVGVTLHHMVARVDAGRIVDREPVPVDPDETAAEVYARIIPAARKVLARALPDILAGRAEGTEQDEALATYV
ncbi:MAG: formyltransferase, partial [Synergistaceae bacterium]|nr:formyltransferase [Synergistaceae bacterium]